MYLKKTATLDKKFISFIFSRIFMFEFLDILYIICKLIFYRYALFIDLLFRCTCVVMFSVTKKYNFFRSLKERLKHVCCIFECILLLNPTSSRDFPRISFYYTRSCNLCISSNSTSFFRLHAYLLYMLRCVLFFFSFFPFFYRTVVLIEWYMLSRLAG